MVDGGARAALRTLAADALLVDGRIGRAAYHIDPGTERSIAASLSQPVLSFGTDRKKVEHGGSGRFALRGGVDRFFYFFSCEFPHLAGQGSAEEAVKKHDKVRRSSDKKHGNHWTSSQPQSSGKKS